MRSLRKLELLVLAVLADATRHGYGIVKAIEQSTGGQVQIRPGNLYRIVRRLEDAGLVGEVEPPAQPLRGPEPGRFFTLTEAGRSALIEEAQSLRGALASADRLAARAGR